MTPAEQRVRELVDKWLKSLELHLKYASLDDEAYWRVQPWVPHQRPARWILELAHARASDLSHQLQARGAAGDTGFADAVELMAFLANLVGAQPLERFVPLADPARENAAAFAPPGSALANAGAGGVAPVSAVLAVEPPHGAADEPVAGGGVEPPVVAAIGAAALGLPIETPEAVDVAAEDQADVVVELEGEWAEAESIELGGEDEATGDGDTEAETDDAYDAYDAYDEEDSAEDAEIALDAEAAAADAGESDDVLATAADPDADGDADTADDDADTADDDDVVHDDELIARGDDARPVESDDDAERAYSAADAEDAELAREAEAADRADRAAPAVDLDHVRAFDGGAAIAPDAVPPRAPANAVAPAFASIAMPTLTMTVTINPVLNGSFGGVAAWPPSSRSAPSPSAAARVPAPSTPAAFTAATVEPAPVQVVEPGIPPSAGTEEPRTAAAATAASPEAASHAGHAAASVPPPGPAAEPAPGSVVDTPAARASVDPAPPASSAAAIAVPTAAPVAATAVAGASVRLDERANGPSDEPAAPAPRVVLPPPLPHVGSPPLTLAALEARIATPKSPPKPVPSPATPRTVGVAGSPPAAVPAPAVAAVSPTTASPSARPPSVAPPATAAPPATSDAAAPRPTSVWVSGATVATVATPSHPPASPAAVESPPWNDETRRSLALRAGVAPPVADAPRRSDVPVLDTPRVPPGKGRKDARPAKGANRAPPEATTPDELVISDAVRLLKWGKEWHELAEAIARMAGRPAAGEVRRMLKTHKADIQKQARH